MNKTAQSERIHIAFIGKRNAGKSSLMNRFIGQDLVIVSEIPGTTTDPVKKSMELLPFGPVVLIDTAGLDDTGELGEKRIQKTLKIISETDFALFVVDSQNPLSNDEIKLVEHLQNFEIPFAVVINKSELGINYSLIEQLNSFHLNYFSVSCRDKTGINELKNGVQKLLPADAGKNLIMDIIKPNDLVVLVVPIDTGAPKGRIILPQVQTIREILDGNAISVVAKENQLAETLSKLSQKPRIVVTDSQAIEKVSKIVPDNIPLTTFSILQARYKGDLQEYVKGLIQVERLAHGDQILIAEACSHHSQDDDIGRIKIPKWLKNYTGKNLEIDVVCGHDYPENLMDYKLIIHCGGCMITRKVVQTRIKQAKIAAVPIVNYGVLISYMHGAIPRAIKPFDEAIAAWNELQQEIEMNN